MATLVVVVFPGVTGKAVPLPTPGSVSKKYSPAVMAAPGAAGKEAAYTKTLRATAWLQRPLLSRWRTPMRWKPVESAPVGTLSGVLTMVPGVTEYIAVSNT